jgi:hypothetical protein
LAVLPQELTEYVAFATRLRDAGRRKLAASVAELLPTVALPYRMLSRTELRAVFAQ